MRERTKSTAINGISRKTTHEPDGYRCVYCGRTDRPIELAHFISRTRGGLGVPKNLISLCGDCHRDYDGARHSEIQPFLAEYLKSKYPDWNENDLIYQKGVLL